MFVHRGRSDHRNVAKWHALKGSVLVISYDGYKNAVLGTPPAGRLKKKARTGGDGPGPSNLQPAMESAAGMGAAGNGGAGDVTIADAANGNGDAAAAERDAMAAMAAAAEAEAANAAKARVEQVRQMLLEGPDVVVRTMQLTIGGLLRPFLLLPLPVCCTACIRRLFFCTASYL